MPQERLVRIDWEGPLTMGEVLTRTGPNDYGIYQVYGHHVVFGSNALVYIGRAREQTFGVRLANRFSLLPDASFRLGRISEQFYKDADDWHDLVADVEALTIWWHSPPYNSKNIKTYRGANLRIQTWMARGDLLPEYTYEWASDPVAARPEDDEASQAS